MVLSITNIADYLTTAKIIIGASANITTKKKTELTTQIDLFKVVTEDFTNINTINPSSLDIKYDQILHNLSSAITITADADNGIIYFTESSRNYYNIMQLFNNDGIGNYNNDIIDDNYIDYYYRFKLLDSIISSENNVIPVKSYTTGSNIKKFYNFIKGLKDTIENTDFVNIVKIFKYYYQMAVLMINHAYLNTILSSFNTHQDTIRTNFTTNILDKIQTKIKDLVIAYVNQASPSEADKTTIINLINLGNLVNPTYSYRFVLDPKNDQEQFVSYSKYNQINTEITNIIGYLENIKDYFTDGGFALTIDNALNNINAMVINNTLDNFKTALESIKSHITGLITEQDYSSTLTAYILFITDLDTFFTNINTLLNSSGSLLSAKQAAITQIGDLEMQRVSVGSEGTFLKENQIVNKIQEINTSDLDDGNAIVTNSVTEITIDMTNTSQSSSLYSASITTLNTFLIDDLRDDIPNSARHFYIKDIINSFIINDPNPATQTLKYYKNPTFGDPIEITKGYPFAINPDETNIYIEVVIFTQGTEEVPATDGNQGTPAVASTKIRVLTITLHRITSNDMFNKHIEPFKANNTAQLNTIFTNLFDSYVNHDTPGINNFGVELVAILNDLALKFSFYTPTSSSPNREHIITIKMSQIEGDTTTRDKFKTNLATLSGSHVVDQPNLELTIPAQHNYLYTYHTTASNGQITPQYLSNIKSDFSSDVTDWFDTFFKYHEQKQAVKDYIDTVVTTATRHLNKYISDSTDFNGTTVETSKNFNESKQAIKDKSKSYKENVDKYKIKNNELNNILKNNLYNNIFLYITIVVLILICLGLIYINNHKASLKTQYSVMLIAFLLLYYIIYTNVTVNITETFYSGSFDSTTYTDAITDLHSNINTFLKLNMYNVNILDDIGKSFKKEKNKYDGFAKSSNSKLNNLELVLNDEFINAIKSKELVKFLILFTAICIISYIVYTNTEDLTTTSIIFIILFVIILMIYFYNINLITRTKADTKYWNHRMTMK